MKKIKIKMNQEEIAARIIEAVKIIQLHKQEISPLTNLNSSY